MDYLKVTLVEMMYLQTKDIYVRVITLLLYFTIDFPPLALTIINRYHTHTQTHTYTHSCTHAYTHEKCNTAFWMEYISHKHGKVLQIWGLYFEEFFLCSHWMLLQKISFFRCMCSVPDANRITGIGSLLL